MTEMSNQTDESSTAEFSRTALQNLADLFISPEIKRRQESGTAEKPFTLFAAQVILYPDARENVIRLNEEVRYAVHTVDGKPAYIDATSGETNVARFSLDERDDQNAGHITAVYGGEPGWTWSFDFIYNKSRSAEHLAAASEFMDGASFASESEHWRLFAECTFAASELISRSYLLGSPNHDYTRKGTHGATQRKINFQSNMGNVPEKYVNILNRFGNARASARYVRGVVAFSPEEVTVILNDLRQFRRFVANRIRFDG